MSLFFRQLGGEMRKLFARKRTYIGFGAFLAVEILLFALLHLPKVQKFISHLIEESGSNSADYLSGLTLAFMVLLWTVFLLGALYLALVAGDVVSKEVEDGTMRMMLCRPIGRWVILLHKFIACAVYTAALILFIALTALTMGLLDRGAGGLFVFSPPEQIFALYDFHHGLARFAVAVPLLALSTMTITALAFFFSCTNMKPAAATITTLSIMFIDSILRNIPYFESLKMWFLTSHMSAWVHVFEYRIPWERITEDYAWLLAVDATLLALGWFFFEERDFKS